MSILWHSLGSSRLSPKISKESMQAMPHKGHKSDMSRNVPSPSSTYKDDSSVESSERYKVWWKAIKYFIISIIPKSYIPISQFGCKVFELPQFANLIII